MESDTPSTRRADRLSDPGLHYAAARPFPPASLRRCLRGAATALVCFALLGTVAALWENPFFIRMTAAGGWEIGLLAILSVLTGVYVALRRSACGMRRAGAGGVMGFLGIACPVCNKILLFLFGGDLLLTYFEPVRIYVAAGGSILVTAAILAAWRGRSQPTPPLSLREPLRLYG